MPMVPCRFSIRVRVAVLARKVASSVMSGSDERTGLLRFRDADAIDQSTPARDLRGEKRLQLVGRRTFHRQRAELFDQRLDVRLLRCNEKLLGPQIDDRPGRRRWPSVRDLAD